MARDPRYDILFEPVPIGPVTAKNRFYQVPHCNGMGYRDPSAMAAMRGVKAEGGWAVVCTEQCEIHPSSEITPFVELRLWDERDIPALARMADAVHAHQALAGIELAYNGPNGSNFYSREVPLGPSNLPIATFTYDPVQARAMDKQDIADLRRWHKTAALRAKRAGFDIVYVYAGHGYSIFEFFLSRRHNDRGDDYGGSLENRARLLREVVEDTRAAVGDTCAVALRLSVDQLIGPAGLHRAEVHDMIGLMAELPDLWDLVLSSWGNDSPTSRFAEEGAQEPFVAGVKRLTTKPVVGVGRFTSPDAMVAQVKRGILDLIGAARPSIADPFLPRKIEEGLLDDIRECIGCNICVSGDMTMSPIRCTQNPTMGEEWRKGWHPERVRPKGSDAKVLVVGAGPAGLECALALGQRGYAVALAEATREPGGRVARECRLPGLAAWGRVRDYRVGQLHKLPNVEVYYDSALTAEQVLEFGFDHVVIATGATWRRDGIARTVLEPIPVQGDMPVYTPDDLMAGRLPAGARVVLYDDDHYYMGGVLAEFLAREGREVTLVTPAADVSNWTHNTLEQSKIQTRLIELGVEIRPQRRVSAIAAGAVETSCVFTGRRAETPCDALVLITARLPNEALARDLEARAQDWAAAGIRAVQAIGDACAPGTIAMAVYAGRRYAEELDGPDLGDAVSFQRELTDLAPP
jgi:dimethylamine/trimethylamine dehydrogenase